MARNDDRKGDWIPTFTGKQFWPFDPRATDFDIVDVAHQLGMVCRYGGAVTRFYSVAEHCVLLSHAVPYRFAYPALMHDLAEAYIYDIVRPVKKSLPEYRTIEGRIEEVGAGHFRVVYPWPDEVIDADRRIVTDERQQLMTDTTTPWADAGEPLGIKVKGWTPEVAKVRFLQRFHELRK